MTALLTIAVVAALRVVAVARRWWADLDGADW